MKRLLMAVAAPVVALGLTAAATAADYPWKPNKPITIIVPWSAGGATDQVTRVTAGDLEDALGVKIVIVNQPGASGSIGKKNVSQAPKDGYTWAAGAPKQLGTYKLLGLFDTWIDDWHVYNTVVNVPMISVNPDTPYMDIPGLLAAFKAKPGKISVATAGASSSGHVAIEAIKSVTGIDYKHVTYDGGNPAVISTVAGETEVTTQLASEQAEMVRGKKLRPLAVVSDLPIVIKGYGEIPAITKWVTGFPSVSTHFGIFIPKGVPDEVVQTFNMVWEDRIKNSAALKKYAGDRGALFAPSYGQQAIDRVMPEIQADAWMLHAAGRTKFSPADLGIKKQ